MNCVRMNHILAEILFLYVSVIDLFFCHNSRQLIYLSTLSWDSFIGSLDFTALGYN